MKALLTVLAASLLAIASYGQGQVVFANRVVGTFDAPVTLVGSYPLQGPGSAFSAQLILVGAGGALTPLLPIQTFRDAGTGAAVIADRYWPQTTVDVPGVAPGENATFRVRAWQTSLGSYDAALATGAIGQSADFTVAVGGGTLPPANLTTLQAFGIGWIPEPSTIALCILGGGVWLLKSTIRGKRLNA